MLKYLIFMRATDERSAEETIQLLFLLIAVLITAFVNDFIWWPIALLPLVGVYFLLAMVVAGLRHLPAWLQIGRLDGRTLFAMAVYTLVCSVVLVAWKHAAQPDLSFHRSRLPMGSLNRIVSAGLAFSIINATIEETVFRGLLQTLAGERLGSKLAIPLQAVLFGLGHLAGVPSGWSGCAMATTYGAGLGVLRKRADGLAACILSHIVVDSTIYAILAWNL